MERGGEPIALFNVRFVHASLPDLEQSLKCGGERRTTFTVQSQPVFETDALNLSASPHWMPFGLGSLGHDFGCTKDRQLNQSDVFSNDETCNPKSAIGVSTSN
jgi:hypothetical protein